MDEAQSASNTDNEKDESKKEQDTNDPNQAPIVKPLPPQRTDVSPGTQTDEKGRFIKTGETPAPG